MNEETATTNARHQETEAIAEAEVNGERVKSRAKALANLRDTPNKEILELFHDLHESQLRMIVAFADLLRFDCPHPLCVGENWALEGIQCILRESIYEGTPKMLRDGPTYVVEKITSSYADFCDSIESIKRAHKLFDLEEPQKHSNGLSEGVAST
jgi:hypothetical protein